MRIAFYRMFGILEHYHNIQVTPSLGTPHEVIDPIVIGN